MRGGSSRWDQRSRMRLFILRWLLLLLLLPLKWLWLWLLMVWILGGDSTNTRGSWRVHEVGRRMRLLGWQLSLSLAISNFGPIDFSPIRTRTTPLAFIGAIGMFNLHHVDAAD